MEDPANVYLVNNSENGGKLVVGRKIDGIPLIEENFHRISLDALEFHQDQKLVSTIEHVGNLVNGGRFVFVYAEGKRRYIFCLCFLRRWCDMSPKEAWSMLSEIYRRKMEEELSFDADEQNQMKRYNPPKTVVIIVDPECNREYDRILPFEIKKLPPYSRIIYILNGGRMDAKITELLDNINDCYLIKVDSIYTLLKEKYKVDKVFLCFYEIKFSSREVKEFINGYMSTYDFYLFDTKIKEKIKDRNYF